jgi:hypothetical protein
VTRPPEYEGRSYTVKSLELADGSCPAGEFFDGLDGSYQAKLDVLFERLGDQGRISNTEKFKRVEGSDHIWAFKSFQVRLLCCFVPNRIVLLLYGLIKKRDKYKPTEITRAEQYRTWYLEQTGRRK